MKIGEVAKLSDVSPDTLRFYESRGLIRPLRSANGYRCFNAETVQLVGYIKLAQSLGFTLAEIGENLPQLWSSSAESAELLADIFVQKINIIDQRIAHMQALRNALAERAREVCPLLQLT